MFNHRIASLEARIARLEKRLSKTAGRFTPKGLDDGFGIDLDPYENYMVKAPHWVEKINDPVLENFFLTLISQDESISKNNVSKHSPSHGEYIIFENFKVGGRVLFGVADFVSVDNKVYLKATNFDGPPLYFQYVDEKGRTKFVSFENGYDAISEAAIAKQNGINVFEGYVEPTLASLFNASKKI